MRDIDKNKRGQRNYVPNKILGDKGEEIFINYLESLCFYNIRKNEQKGLENLKLWDIEGWYNNKRWTFEVKTDARSAETGNLCVEESRQDLSGNRVLSGINVTTADFFVFVIPDIREICIIYTSILKNLIESKKPDIKTYLMGDESRTRGYLLKKKNYIQYYRALKKY